MEHFPVEMILMTILWLAEIPDPDLYPGLHQKVVKFMLHSRCDVDKKAPCLNDDGVCSKGFPKDYCDRTEITEVSSICVVVHEE